MDFIPNRRFEWHWPLWIREMTGACWILLKNRWFACYLALEELINISHQYWSLVMLTRSLDKVSSFSFLLSRVSFQTQRTVDHLWTLARGWTSLSSHLILCPHHLLFQWWVQCVFTHLPLFVFKPNMWEGSKGHSLFALPCKGSMGEWDRLMHPRTPSAPAPISHYQDLLRTLGP